MDQWEMLQEYRAPGLLLQAIRSLFEHSEGCVCILGSKHFLCGCCRWRSMPDLGALSIASLLFVNGVVRGRACAGAAPGRCGEERFTGLSLFQPSPMVMNKHITGSAWTSIMPQVTFFSPNFCETEKKNRRLR